MKLSKSFELGLAIIIVIAKQPDNSTISAGEIANQLQSSLTYSQKLLRKFVVAGLVVATSGSSGGFTLAKPAAQISLADVVTALDGSVASFASSGLLERTVSATSSNSTSHAFQTADLVWQQVLSQTTLANLLWLD